MAWLFFIVSIICGLDHLSALAGPLAPVPDEAATSSAGRAVPQEPLPPRVTGINEIARGAMFRQLLTFVVATVLMLVYGYLSLRFFCCALNDASQASG